jgi:hypothetical protein
MIGRNATAPAIADRYTLEVAGGCASAALIDETGVVGFAMKKLDSGSDEPASEPLRKFGPVEFRCTAGTKALRFPLAVW